MYSAYDLQNHRYFQTGRNVESRSDCIKKIRDYLTAGSNLPDEDYEHIPDDEILDMFEVEIREHDQPIQKRNELISAV